MDVQFTNWQSVYNSSYIVLNSLFISKLADNTNNYDSLIRRLRALKEMNLDAYNEAKHDFNDKVLKELTYYAAQV